MADLIDLYNHNKSRPKKTNPDHSAAFSPAKPLSEISCARPCLSSWATRLVGNHAYFRVGKLARKGTGRNRRQLRAATNGRTEKTDVVEWEDIEFTIEGLGAQYQTEDPFLWYLTECFSASRKKGKAVVKNNRPHPIVRHLRFYPIRFVNSRRLTDPSRFYQLFYRLSQSIRQRRSRTRTWDLAFRLQRPRRYQTGLLPFWLQR